VSIPASSVIPVVISVLVVSWIVVFTVFQLKIPQGGIAVASLVTINRYRNPQIKKFIVLDVYQHHLRVPSARSTL
jgi:hypothetical protein